MTTKGALSASERLKVTHDNQFKGAVNMVPAAETLIDRWLEYLSEQGKSDYTITAYRRAAHYFVRWSRQTYSEDFDATATLPRDLERWKTYQVRVQKSAPATVNQRLVAVSCFFNWCLNAGIIAQDPTHSLKTLRLEKHPPRSIAEVHLNRLLRVVHKGGDLRDISIIEVLSGTGIRVGELLALQVEDIIDLDKRSAYLIVRQGKHGNYRSVPLIKNVRQALADYLAQQPSNPQAGAALWVGRRGPLLQSSSVLRLLDKYCIRAGLQPVTPHQLRHTFATRYLQKNPGDLRSLAALLGHSDLNTVMLYTEPSLRDLADRLESLDEDAS